MRSTVKLFATWARDAAPNRSRVSGGIARASAMAVDNAAGSRAGTSQPVSPGITVSRAPP